jgi:DNA primase
MQPLSPFQRQHLEEAVSSYEWGVTEGVVQWLSARGVEPGTAISNRLGVVETTEFGHWQGRLAIPYLDRDGRPLTIRFRCLKDHNCKEVGCPKYLPITGDPSRVYNVGAIHRATDEIHVTEGEFDAIILGQLGLHAVAIAGAMGWQSHHRRMLAGFSRIYVWGDPDPAGTEFANKVTRSLRSAKAMRLKGGDVTDVYLNNGAEGILGLLPEVKESV